MTAENKIRFVRAARWIATTLAGCLLAGGVLAGDGGLRAPFRQDFEDRTPGQRPEGWGAVWGEQGGDLAVVTNIRACGGRQSMLVDRHSGENAEAWRLARDLPDIREGWARLRFSMLVDGPGERSRFTIRLRERTRRSDFIVELNVGLRGWGPTIYLYPTIHNWQGNWDGKRPMTEYARNVWHRITVYCPTEGNPAKHVYGMVEARDGQGPWRLAGRPQRVDGKAPAHGFGGLSIDFLKEQRGFDLFIDELTFESVDELPAVFDGVE